MDLNLAYPPRNKESVFGQKQELVAKVSDKRKIQNFTEHRVVEIITYTMLRLW
jgi:hypothetical protein